MASISRQPNGRRTVQFVAADGKRRSVRLGKVSQKTAEEIKTKVEALNAAATAKVSIDTETARWIGDLDAVLYDKLAGAGLVPKRTRPAQASLAAFITDYIAKRTDVKPATKEVWGQGERSMIGFFSAGRALNKISRGEADEYKLHLIGLKLASMTVRKRLQFAKMICRAAVRHKLMADDPFADVTIKAGMPDRHRFVTLEETTKLLDACPDQDWRTIVALARYGGLRCPSEVLSLRWQDVDWTGGKIVVQSPKTEHHPGKATRTIPLFPELREQLEAAFDPQAVYVVDERFRKSALGVSGWRNCNLRTTFEKIIKRAGLKPWPRMFHNLRSSKATELAKEFPGHVAAEWLGHSATVAAKHYWQTTDADFQRAASKPACSALQNPVQQPAETACTPSHAPRENPVISRACDTVLEVKRMGRDSNPR